MTCAFPLSHVDFCDGDRMNALPLHQKLGYMANSERANVGSDVFSYDIARCDFPELFEKILKNERYHDLALDDMEVFPEQLVFILATEDRAKARLEIPLKGTSGKFQVNKGDYKFAVVEWKNGKVESFDLMVCGGITHVSVCD